MTERHKHRLPERLRKREAERKAALEKKKQDEDATAKDNIQHFLLEFAKAKSEIEEKLSGLSDVKEDLNLAFDELNMAIQKLQKFVSDSVLFLPSYNLQSSQQHISQLQTMLTTKQDDLMPKKKFAFTMRKKERDPSLDSDLPREDKHNKLSIPLLISNASMQCGFSNKQDENLSMQDCEINGYDVILDSLSRCDVKLFGSPLTLHVTNCSECKIFSGPVCSSVFIDNCKNCTFLVACQQLRTHRTTCSVFYLHVTSKGIIEDCNDIKFAPYNWNYPEIDVHYKTSGLDKTKNNWNRIDDFNWLSANEPSPHWKVIEESNRVKSWDETSLYT